MKYEVKITVEVEAQSEDAAQNLATMGLRLITPDEFTPGTITDWEVMEIAAQD